MLIKELYVEQSIDISKACRLLSTSRSSYHYLSTKDDKAVEELLLAQVHNHPREGFWKSRHRIKNAGVCINHKRLHRVYKQLGLPMRRKTKKRLPARVKQKLEVPTSFTHTWSMDFTSDALSNGRKFRSFNIIDDYNREVLFIESDYSLKSSRVMWVLRHLINKYGKPQRIRMDNGPEFIANLSKSFSEMYGIEFKYIQPGKPTQNAYIERFNKTYREMVLDAYLFRNLDEVREVNETFMNDYNHYRPHDALGGQSPVMWKCGQLTHTQALSKPDHITTLENNNNNDNQKFKKKFYF